MTDILWHIGEAVWFIFAAAMALALFGGIYLICCGPGIGLLRLIRRWRREPRLPMVLAVAAVHAIFFAPAVILGHTPFIVTVFVGAIVYRLIDETGRTWWLAASAGLVFLGSLIYQYVRSNSYQAPGCQRRR